MEERDAIHFEGPGHWRSWPAEHHASSTGVWLGYRRKHTGPAAFEARLEGGRALYSYENGDVELSEEYVARDRPAQLIDDCEAGRLIRPLRY